MSWGTVQGAVRLRRVPLVALVAPLALAAFAALFGGSGCQRKVSPKQCDELLGRFAELVVRERYPDAGAQMIAAERERERKEAQSDDAFKNCPSEVQPVEHECAMKASSAETLIKCLE